MADNPKLIVLSEKLRGKIFDLTADKVTVGRNEQRDICIKDPSISSHHCDFVRRGDKYVLVDNDSTNGSRVNNVQISEQELKNSDIIQLGGVEILFDHSGNDVSAASRTQTGIELSTTESSIDTVPNFNNLSPFANDDVKRQQKNHKIMLIVLAILGVGFLGLLGWAFYLILSK